MNASESRAAETSAATSTATAVSAAAGSAGHTDESRVMKLAPLDARAGKRAYRRRKALTWATQLAIAVFIVGGWQLFTTVGWVDKFFFGQPSGIAKQLYNYFAQGEQATEFGSYPYQIEVTLKEAVFGFFLGASGGIVVGIALGQSDFMARAVGPFIKIVNAIPRIVLGSIFAVAFGLDSTPKILLSGVLVFFGVFFNAFQGVREVNPDILANAKVLGASRWQVTRHVTLPSALTWILASLHAAFGLAIIGAVVGEVLGAQYGLGLVIKTAQNNSDANAVFAGMATIAIIVLAAEWLLTKVERRLLSWQPISRTEASSI